MAVAGPAPTTSGTPKVLWTPPPDVCERSRIGHYLDWLERRIGRS